MSANGVKIDGTGYQKTKHLSEQYLKYTKLNWTIFRPSLVFGDPRGNNRPEFCTQLKKDMFGNDRIIVASKTACTSIAPLIKDVSSFFP